MSTELASESSRARPASGGLRNFFSWLRRDDSLHGRVDSVESLSSTGSDHTVTSFSFLPPGRYESKTTILPVIISSPDPPTDSYRKRIRDRNLRRHLDRDLTLVRKYRLPTVDSISNYDASSLPAAHRSIGNSKQERCRRAASEYHQRRAPYVPGKRHAPPPPNRSSLHEPLSVPIYHKARKRQAPQPPITDKSIKKENNDTVNVEKHKYSYQNNIAMNQNTQSLNYKERKVQKKSNTNINTKNEGERNFLKQLFDSKKRISVCDPFAVRLLPNISELDRQTTEIIQQKLRNSNQEKDDLINKSDLYRNKETKVISSQNKNAEDIQNSMKENLDEKEQLKKMLKEMKDSLPKRSKANFVADPIVNAPSTSQISLENKFNLNSQLNNVSLATKIPRPSGVLNEPLVTKTKLETRNETFQLLNKNLNVTSVSATTHDTTLENNVGKVEKQNQISCSKSKKEDKCQIANNLQELQDEKTVKNNFYLQFDTPTLRIGSSESKSQINSHTNDVNNTRIIDVIHLNKLSTDVSKKESIFTTTNILDLKDHEVNKNVDIEKEPVSTFSSEGNLRNKAQLANVISKKNEKYTPSSPKELQQSVFICKTKSELNVICESLHNPNPVPSTSCNNVNLKECSTISNISTDNKSVNFNAENINNLISCSTSQNIIPSKHSNLIQKIGSGLEKDQSDQIKESKMLLDPVKCEKKSNLNLTSMRHILDLQRSSCAYKQEEKKQTACTNSNDSYSNQKNKQETNVNCSKKINATSYKSEENASTKITQCENNDTLMSSSLIPESSVDDKNKRVSKLDIFTASNSNTNPDIVGNNNNKPTTSNYFKSTDEEAKHKQLVLELEQYIIQGDERGAAKAATRLAQLRLPSSGFFKSLNSCEKVSSISNTESQIFSEPNNVANIDVELHKKTQIKDNMPNSYLKPGCSKSTIQIIEPIVKSKIRNIKEELTEKYIIEKQSKLCKSPVLQNETQFNTPKDHLYNSNFVTANAAISSSSSKPLPPLLEEDDQVL